MGVGTLESTNLASDGEGQDTGIRVDLDAEDGKAVTRARPKTPGKKNDAPPDWAQERAETSKAVKARIQRLQRGFDQRLADQQAEFQRQIAELRAERKVDVTREDTTTADEAAHEKAMDALQASLEEAQERGDSKGAAKITREMSALDAKFWALKTAKKTGEAARTETVKPNGEQQQTQTQRKPTKAGVAWAKANADWWNDTVDEDACDARAYANAIHARKLAEGVEDPEDPDYFEAIGRQVKKRFPEVEVVSTKRRANARIDDDHDDADGDDDAPPARRTGTLLPNRGGPSPNARNGNFKTLTKADISTMRQVGLNPDNNAHVLQFLKSVQETEAEA